MGRWSPEATGAEWLKGATGPAVGARFKGSNRNESRRWSTTCTVVEADRGRAFSFDVTVGPLKISRWAYRFTPAAGGGCTVVEEWTDQRPGFTKPLGKLASGVGDRLAHNRAGMEQTLANLKAAAEGATSPSA
jgi:hypothetical protein